MTSWSGRRKPLPRSTRERIYRRDKNTCQACLGSRCNNTPLVVDHIVPVAEGGTDDDHNLQLLGQSPCHDDKTRAEIERGKARKSERRPKPIHPVFEAAARRDRSNGLHRPLT